MDTFTLLTLNALSEQTARWSASTYILLGDYE